MADLADSGQSFFVEFLSAPVIAPERALSPRLLSMAAAFRRSSIFS